LGRGGGDGWLTSPGGGLDAAEDLVSDPGRWIVSLGEAGVWHAMRKGKLERFLGRQSTRPADAWREAVAGGTATDRGLVDAAMAPTYDHSGDPT
jgi:hypothetical protein